MGAKAGCGQEPLGPILNKLLDCMALAFEDCGAPVCRLFLATSHEPPWDLCCDCGVGTGQAWVTVTKITPLLSPTMGPGPVRCNSVYEATVKMGIVRCAVGMSETGEPPSAMAMTAEAEAVLQDRLSLTRALTLCFSYTQNPNTGMGMERDDWTIGDWDSLGPQGGCVGGELSLTIRFNDRC